MRRLQEEGDGLVIRVVGVHRCVVGRCSESLMYICGGVSNHAHQVQHQCPNVLDCSHWLLFWKGRPFRLPFWLPFLACRFHAPLFAPSTPRQLRFVSSLHLPESAVAAGFAATNFVAFSLGRKEPLLKLECGGHRRWELQLVYIACIAGNKNSKLCGGHRRRQSKTVCSAK